MTFFDYFKAVAVICIVIYFAYYLTKLIAKSGGGSFRKPSGLKLMGSLQLAKDKSVAVVEIGKFAYILGVSGQRVERLDKVELSELKIKEEEPTAVKFSSSFKNELLTRMKNMYK